MRKTHKSIKSRYGESVHRPATAGDQTIRPIWLRNRERDRHSAIADIAVYERQGRIGAGKHRQDLQDIGAEVGPENNESGCGLIMPTITPTPPSNFVLILGTGASADYGMPVMRNFMETARNLYFELQANPDHSEIAKDYESLLSFQKRCRGSSWAVNRDWDNIEELYTQADLKRLADLPPSDTGKKICDHLAWAIWDVYRRSEEGRHPSWRESLLGIRNGLHLTPVLVSTNYDVVQEVGIEAGGLQYFYPGFKPPWEAASWFSEEVGGHGGPWTAPDTAVQMIKLHGSVNWFNINEGERSIATTNLKDSDSTSVTYKGFSRHDFASRLKDHLGSDVSPVPAIIPPMRGKMSLLKVVAHQWNAAIKAISNAKYVAIVGYSFPSTDAFMVRLLAEGIANNHGLERIIICDIADYDSWVDRLATIFNPIVLKTKVTLLREHFNRASFFFQQLHQGSIWAFFKNELSVG